MDMTTQEVIECVIFIHNCIIYKNTGQWPCSLMCLESRSHMDRIKLMMINWKIIQKRDKMIITIWGGKLDLSLPYLDPTQCSHGIIRSSDDKCIIRSRAKHPFERIEIIITSQQTVRSQAHYHTTSQQFVISDLITYWLHNETSQAGISQIKQPIVTVLCELYLLFIAQLKFG